LEAVLEPSEIAFYATVAQVIPLLFLAVTVEFRYFGPWEGLEQRWSTFIYLLGLAMSAALVLGEFCALRVAARGKASEVEAYGVNLSLLLGLFFVFLGLALRLHPAVLPKLWEYLTRTVLAAALVGVVIAAIFGGPAPR